MPPSVLLSTTMHNSTANSTASAPLVPGQGEENSTLDNAGANIGVPLVFAILLFKFALIAAWRMLRRKTWYFSVFCFALLLEVVGLGFQAYLNKHETNHEADVINFALLTLAPVLIVLTTFITFGRLLQWTHHPRSFLTMLLRPTLIGPVLICVEFIPAGLLVAGTICYARFHSSKPILTHEDAVARLTALDTANGLFAAGYAFQTVVLSAFTLVSIGAMCVSPSWGPKLDKDEEKMQNRWRRFTFALSFIGFCLGGRAVYKLITFGGLASHNFALVESDAEFCLFDMLPLLLVCLSYSIFFPGAHLPRRFRGIWAKSGNAAIGARTLDVEGEPQGKPPAYNEKGVAL